MKQLQKRLEIMNFFIVIAISSTISTSLLFASTSKKCSDLLQDQKVVELNFDTTLIEKQTLDLLERKISETRKKSESIVGTSLQKSVTYFRTKLSIWAIRSIAKNILAEFRKNKEVLSEDIFFLQFEKELKEKSEGLLGFFTGDQLQLLINNLSLNRKDWTASMRMLMGMANNVHNEFSKDYNKFKLRFDERLFDKEGFRTALMNVFAMRAFARFAHNSNEPLKAINALALLHPLVDSAIDLGMANKNSMKKIAIHLEKQDQIPDGPFEFAVLSLIDDIYEEYPPALHPKLVWLLSNTFRTELESAKQKISGYSEQTLKLTVAKGAFSTSAFGYIAMRGMTETQFSFFYKSGALFQLMDDFCDITVDLEQGVETLFTKRIQQGESLQSIINSLIELFQNIESEVKNNSSQNSDLLDYYRFLAVSFHIQMLVSISKLPANQTEGALNSYAQLHPLSNPHIKHFGLRALQSYNYATTTNQNPFISELYQFLFQSTPFPSTEEIPDQYKELVDQIHLRFQTL